MHKSGWWVVSKATTQLTAVMQYCVRARLESGDSIFKAWAILAREFFLTDSIIYSLIVRSCGRSALSRNAGHPNRMRALDYKEFGAPIAPRTDGESKGRWGSLESLCQFRIRVFPSMAAWVVRSASGLNGSGLQKDGEDDGHER